MIQPLQQWLERKPRGPAPRRRIAILSERKKAALYVYGKKRKIFLASRPFCECCRTKKARDVHHKHGRLGSFFLDERTWMAACRDCHDWIHQHPSKARAKGWLA